MNVSKMIAVMIAVAALAMNSACSPSPTASGPALPARSSDADAVEIVVRPLTNAPAAGAWEFEVSLNTHTKAIDTDLARAAVLVDDGGRRFSPTSWEGDPPGGHHREGKLRFRFDGEKPKSIELQLDGIGGPNKRVFQWQLAQP